LFLDIWSMFMFKLYNLSPTLWFVLQNDSNEKKMRQSK
jgi:hypothetical protein